LGSLHPLHQATVDVVVDLLSAPAIGLGEFANSRPQSSTSRERMFRRECVIAEVAPDSKGTHGAR
ncbi:MAG: hypothetical protein ACXVB2_04180, partial [Isosphaeraceae bacterium]